MNNVDKQQLIYQIDKQNNVIGTSKRIAQISSFIAQDDSETPFELIKNWVLFQNPNRLTDKDKRDTIVKYEMWLADGAGMTLHATELPPRIDKFIALGDTSTTYYDLLINWEAKTYNTLDDLKKKHIKQFIKTKHLK